MPDDLQFQVSVFAREIYEGKKGNERKFDCPVIPVVEIREIGGKKFLEISQEYQEPTRVSHNDFPFSDPKKTYFRRGTVRVGMEGCKKILKLLKQEKLAPAK